MAQFQRGRRAKSAVEEGRLPPAGLPYLRFGRGPDLVVLNGITPRNANPTGVARRAVLLTFRALARTSTVWLVNRRPGLPDGVGMDGIAGEHAGALAERFTAPVDVLGISTGGSVALQLAADHPEVVRRLVVTGAAHRVGDLGRDVLLRVADLHERGRSRLAYREFARASTTSPLLQKLLGDLQWLTEPLVFGRGIDRSDWVRTLRAEAAFDLGPRLGDISTPTLVIGGDRDLAYPVELFAATAHGMHDGRLLVYAGRSHGGTLADRRFAVDVREFLSAG